MAATAPSAFRLRSWLVEPALDELRAGEQVVKLEPRTMRLLCVLAEQPGRVFSSDELLDAVWPGVVVGQHSVYQAVAQLRRVLGDDSDEPTYIATVPRKGYRLIAPVESPDVGTVARSGAAESSVAPPQLPAPQQEAAPHTAPRSRWRWRLPLVAATLLAVTASLAWWLLRGPGTAAASTRTIAVLPFQDLSTARDNQVFCDGLTEELLNALAHLPDLRVTARNSAFALRDSTRDVRTVGNRLGVKYLLDGSVRRDGARVRVTAQLVSVEDGFQVWSNSFDRPYADVLTIQESIARDVARVLEVKLSPEADRRLGAPPTPKISAYELYLLGRFQQQQRTPEALERAIEYQQQAIAIDPGFALAYAGLADAHMARVYYANRLLAEEEPDILRAVDRALALNPQLAEAYAARAVLRTEQWNSDAAIEDLNRAIAILPNYADAYVRLGAAYEYRAEPALALKNYEAAAQLDPLHVQLHVRRCLTLQNMGRYQPAAQACERALTLKPGNANTLWARALIDLGRGRVDVAIRGYREAVAAAPHRADLLAQLGWLYLDLGMIEEGRAALDHAVEDGRDVPAIRLERARLFLATGDRRALQMYLDSLGLAAVANAAELLDAALLEQVAGRDDVAQALAARALRDPDFHEERLLNNVWATRWGRSDILTLAELALRSGDRAGHERYTKMLSAWIERVIRNGQVWHGAEYLRGALLALRGDPDGAMAALQRAYALGWRRGWWLRNDPAFAQLRGRADFARLLQRMESDDSVMRAKLSPR